MEMWLLVAVSALVGALIVGGLPMLFRVVVRRLAKAHFAAVRDAVTEEVGLPGSSGIYSRDGAPEEGPPTVPLKKLPVIQPPPKCQDCTAFNLEAGQRALSTNPAFRQVMNLQQPYQQGWQRNPVHIDLEKDIVALMQADAPEGPGSELAQKRAQLEATPEWHRGGLNDPGVQASMALKWEDFGMCTKRSTVLANTDHCEQFTRRESTAS